jgi:hypothetical protein
MCSEEWRVVPGYPDYDVSTLGRVRSRRRVLSGRFLKSSPNRYGYLRVFLYSSLDSSRREFFVHRLVLEAFVGPCPEGMEACHGELGKLVNTPENLSWGTREKNIADRLRDGTLRFGERCYNAKLTEDDVRYIRQSDERGVDLAVKFGVYGSTISQIRNLKTWKHLDAEKRSNPL